jgi:putative transposase
MGRVARVVVLGFPHHVTQRGNRRQRTFFSDADYELYLDLLRKYLTEHEVELWAYCLMPNHVHLIAVPKQQNSLRKSIGEIHRQYTLTINSREKWTGHLWQGRFSSYPMDEKYLIAAARYIELNPVRARLVRRPEEWPWSSARIRIKGKNDGLTELEPLRSMVGNWARFLESAVAEIDLLRKHQSTGRPLGSDAFIEECEGLLGRVLRPKKPGPQGRRKTKP